MSRSAAIDIAWDDRKLEKRCSSDTSGSRAFGADRWKLLRRRLDALSAAPTLSDMDEVPGKCHALTADRSGQFAVHLWGAYRLVFVPDHNPMPELEDGGLDRRRVTKISIVEVVDYHG